MELIQYYCYLHKYHIREELEKLDEILMSIEQRVFKKPYDEYLIHIIAKEIERAMKTYGLEHLFRVVIELISGTQNGEISFRVEEVGMHNTTNKCVVIEKWNW